MAEEKLSKGQYWLGVVVIAAFGLFVAWMTGQVASSETAWARLIYLFGGVEAIVFAAVGAIFGTQVQRSNVAKAEERAKEARDDAKASAADADVGRTIEAALRADLPTESTPPPARSDRIGAGAALPPPSPSESEKQVIARLLRIAAEVRSRHG